MEQYLMNILKNLVLLHIITSLTIRVRTKAGKRLAVFAVCLVKNNPAVIAVGVERLWAICLFYFLCGIMEVLCYSIRGLGYSMMPTLVTLLGACGLRILWIATVFQIPQYHTIHTIYLSYGISWAVTALAHAVCFIWAFRRLKRRMAAEPAES